MTKLKKWIINKLGGMVFEDLHDEVRALIIKNNLKSFKELCEITLENEIVKIFLKSFSVENNYDKPKSKDL